MPNENSCSNHVVHMLLEHGLYMGNVTKIDNFTGDFVRENFVWSIMLWRRYYIK